MRGLGVAGNPGATEWNEAVRSPARPGKAGEERQFGAVNFVERQER
jgi:hypothetical protein